MSVQCWGGVPYPEALGTQAVQHEHYSAWEGMGAVLLFSPIYPGLLFPPYLALVLMPSSGQLHFSHIQSVVSLESEAIDTLKIESLKSIITFIVLCAVIFYIL